MKESRPDPDQLLENLKKDEAKASRGKLRVFFGMCPGVGKTYSMLKAAHDLKSRGIDIVIGVIEHHDRVETKELMTGLRAIPRKVIEHKGTRIEEFNLDQALAEHPPVLLVDELAHTNAPGSRHSKRYQDVEELLANGIDVFTTINVQHIASRADLVYQITQVPIREVVPDSFIEEADQIELIDLSSEQLLKRLHDGKVYLGDRAERAAAGFFKEEKLTALRELALRFTAEKVDDQLKKHMSVKRILGPWNTNERLMVAVSHSPFSARLIRATRRTAYSLEAPWIALYVDTGQRLSEDDRKTLSKNIDLAKELGAELVTTRDENVADAIYRIAHEKNVTQIVMGRPDRRFFRDLFAGGHLLDRLLKESNEIDLHVIRNPRGRGRRSWISKLGLDYREFQFKFDFFPYWSSTVFLGVVIALGYSASDWIGYRAVGFLFLAAILLIAFLTTLGPTLVGAVLSAVAWNYFFIPPRFAFSISEPEDYMMCASYLFTALAAGALTSRIRRQDRLLLDREKRAQALYAFSQGIAEASGESEIAGRAIRSLAELFSMQAAVLLVDETGKLSLEPCHYSGFSLDEKMFAVADWCFRNRKRAGSGTDTLGSSECLCLPLLGRQQTIGTIVLIPEKKAALGTDRETLLSSDRETLLDTIVSHLAVALEREIFEKSARSAKVLAESEKLHQAILNSVSHEIRTPLTTILGSSISPEVREAADRLNRVVENLLDMSRVSTGVLKIDRDLFEWTDFVHSALVKIRKWHPQRSIDLLEGEEGFVRGDERLLEHVLMNLVQNASAYSPVTAKIEIFAGVRLDQAVLEIRDRGPGIADEWKERIFERFFRIPGSPAGGTGLGLTIVRAIVEAHGGRIEVLDREEFPGSIFRISLPLSKEGEP